MDDADAALLRQAMAMCDSVTVSMAELTMGMFSAILRVSQVLVSASAGITALRAGTRRTSSKVRPFRDGGAEALKPVLS